MTMVGLLDRCPTGDRERSVSMANRGDSFMDEVVGAIDAADGIMNLRWAVERDDDVVEESSNLVGAFAEEKTCGEEGEMNVLLAKEVAQGCEIVVQQWLATSEDDLANAKVGERRPMALQVLCMELVGGFAFPDVAHDATAVAATVNIENENRKSCQARGERLRCVRFM
jgi:hypothetical protein